MAVTVVDRLQTEFSDLLAVLDRAKEISLRSVADDNLRKALLMAAASYFERRMTEAVLKFSEEVTTAGHVLTWLVKNKAVSRQYHTWFNWEAKNANRFFGLFGEEFQTYAKREVASDPAMEIAVRAFLEIGRERNRLVHQDFGSFSLEKTFDEIYKLYSDAIGFVDWFPTAIRQFVQDLDPESARPE